MSEEDLLAFRSILGNCFSRACCELFHQGRAGDGGEQVGKQQSELFQSVPSEAQHHREGDCEVWRGGEQVERHLNELFQNYPSEAPHGEALSLPPCLTSFVCYPCGDVFGCQLLSQYHSVPVVLTSVLRS